MVAEIFYNQYFEVVFEFRSSSMGGHPHFKPNLILVWSTKLKFEFEEDPISGC